MTQYRRIIICVLLICSVSPKQIKSQQVVTGTINRKALVERHTIHVNSFDSLSSLSAGNGAFAFTVDITGLQSFPHDYVNGVPLGTESEWGWHSFPNDKKYRFEEVLRYCHFNNRDIPYAVEIKQSERNKGAVDYFRQNPHRLQLGNIGFEIIKKDGSFAVVRDIENIHQTLNMWTGEIHSTFSIENIPVDVTTYCHQRIDAISVKVISPLIKSGRLNIRILFPPPTGNWADRGISRDREDIHNTAIVSQTNDGATILHTLDSTAYYTYLKWTNSAVITEKSRHCYIVRPSEKRNNFEFTFYFTPKKSTFKLPSFTATANNSRSQWKSFWKSGGAVDLTGSTDNRAFELERRIILSEYLTKIQCAGNNPPQETGLTYNSWYGKPHMEMLWWHAVHFALWGRTTLLEKQLSWYVRSEKTAAQIASRQGYRGVRWQKMTDNQGGETPSSVGSFLIWQQPHLIYFAELCYRTNSTTEILKRYRDLVFSTADFMASYAFYDSVKGKYILGKGLIPAQERFKPEETFNPAFELAYWYWGLSTAQQWRERMHLPRNKKWDEVLQQLSPLPVQNNKYLFAESAADSYTKPGYSTDHPSVLGAFGMLPGKSMVDRLVMQNTFDWIWKNWKWEDTWGWDFPMTAMSAARLGLPDKAIDALMMNIKTNTYLNNGHNYQDERLTIYLPGNGGLLSAIAMMCAGFDNSTENNPGIPKDGKWKVRWEGLYPMP